MWQSNTGKVELKPIPFVDNLYFEKMKTDIKTIVDAIKINIEIAKINNNLIYKKI